jgi:electron transport complex protein RnfC
VSAVVKDWDAFQILAPPLDGARPLKSLRRGQAVSAGEKLALDPRPGHGDLHAPASGLIEEINELEIVIRRDEEAVGRPPEALDLGRLPPGDLAAAVKGLGLDLPPQPAGTPLIVNTLKAEPGLDLAPALFGERRETLAAGLEAAARLWPAAKIIWAVARAGEAPAESDFRLIRAAYPHGLPALVKKKITGQSDPRGLGVRGGRELYLLGRIWRTGRPLTAMPLTLGGANYFVPLGARVADLLSFANLVPGPDDLIVLNGLVRGRTLGRLNRGLGLSAAALHLVRNGGRPGPAAPCRHCGQCGRACPVSLPVEALAAEEPREWLKEAGPRLAGCLLCGLCALVCPAGRPLMDMIRLKAG